MNDRFLEDTKNLFYCKCQEIHKDGKIGQLSKSTAEAIMLLINPADVFRSESFFSDTFASFLLNTRNKLDDMDLEHKIKEKFDNKYFVELERLFKENIQDETTAFEKILQDLSSYLAINVTRAKQDSLDSKINEKSLASFILFLCKHQTWVEDKENRYLNKAFLKPLNSDLAMIFEVFSDKKSNANLNTENFYRHIRKQIESMDVIK